MGQKFQVHGIHGSVYNLISHSHLQVNGLFSFLRSGQCPVSHPDILCWSHPGSYISTLGFMIRQTNGQVITVQVVAGDAAKGFAAVTVQNVSMSLSPAFHSLSIDQSVTLTIVDSHHLTLSTPSFIFSIDSSDDFLNQKIQPTSSLSRMARDEYHGIIGQTMMNKIYPRNQVKYLEGIIDDYLITEQNIFGQEFTFNQWKLK